MKHYVDVVTGTYGKIDDLFIVDLPTELEDSDDRSKIGFALNNGKDLSLMLRMYEKAKEALSQLD